MAEQQWYTNKDLFEQINRMQGEFQDLRSEMKQTRDVIKKYNGLREEMGAMNEQIRDVKDEMEAVKNKTQGKNTVFEAIRNWGGWLFGLITLVVLVSTKI